jgi:starch synthase (maltosyl-transferring)
MKEPGKMIIYNLFPTLAGTFSNWEKYMARASEMGFNWLFVNPIQLPGQFGSIYGIADYFAFNPLLIDQKSGKKPEEQVKEAIQAAEKLGLQVMVDLVINHCAADSKLLKSHPEWFAWEAKGQVVHPGADENGKTVVWQELAKFDYQDTEDKEGLYQFCFKVVKFLADLGFKGFRCDAAYQIPKIFWERLIGETKKIYPDRLFFAETLGCSLNETIETAGSGFDYIFNSAKWWDFESPWLMEQYARTRETVPSIAFPESHDTVRLCKELDGNVAGLKQRYLFSALFSAGVMMPVGFEFGFRQKLHVVKTRPSDWEKTDIDLTSFITKVNKIKAEHAFFQEDAATRIIKHTHPRVLFIWKGGSARTNEESLIILNKDIGNNQHFEVRNLYHYLRSKAPLTEVSPEVPPEYSEGSLSSPFSRDLLPGQGIVLVT